MKRPRRRGSIIAIAMTASLGIGGCSGSNEPSSYEECVLKHLKGVNDRTVAVIIDGACHDLFPSDQQGAESKGGISDHWDDLRNN